MNALVILGLILASLMIIVGGRSGLRAFISLFLNLFIIVFSVLLMTDNQANILVITLISVLVIAAVNLFFTNKINSKTITAFIATLVTIILLVSLIYLFTEAAMIYGFGAEQIEELTVYSLYIGIDFKQLAVSLIIMSTIGAIIDMTISITSPMREIAHHNPDFSVKKLFHSGLTIGKDILGSNANTLFFAFFGGYLALLIWFKDLSYTLGEVVNSNIFGIELFIIFFAGIGIALAIPISSLINAIYLKK